MTDDSVLPPLTPEYTAAAEAFSDAVWIPSTLEYTVRELVRLTSANLHGCGI